MKLNLTIWQNGLDPAEVLQVTARVGLYDAAGDFVRQSPKSNPKTYRLDDLPANIKSTLNALQKQWLEWRQAEGDTALGAGTVS